MKQSLLPLCGLLLVNLSQAFSWSDFTSSPNWFGVATLSAVGTATCGYFYYKNYQSFTKEQKEQEVQSNIKCINRAITGRENALKKLYKNSSEFGFPAVISNTEAEVKALREKLAKNTHAAILANQNSDKQQSAQTTFDQQQSIRNKTYLTGAGTFCFAGLTLLSLYKINQ